MIKKTMVNTKRLVSGYTFYTYVLFHLNLPSARAGYKQRNLADLTNKLMS